MNYAVKKTTLGALQGPEAGLTILPNLPRSGFFVVFHREQKLSRTKIANQFILIKKGSRNHAAKLSSGLRPTGTGRGL
jgi:hypothetical protein